MPPGTSLCILWGEELDGNKLINRPIQLTQCCTQFRSLGVKVLCVFHLHDNIAFTFK